MLHPSFLADVLGRARAGDRQAADELLAALRPYLERLAHDWADPGQAGESSADLVQEAALRVWQKLAQFQGGPDEAQTAAMFHEWVGRLVRHLGLDRRRQGQAQRRQPPEGLLRLDAAQSTGGVDPAAGGPTPSVSAGAEEQARLVRAALENVPDAAQREVVRLCFFEGLSLRQIAGRLNLTYDQVRDRYHRGLEVLERELGGLL